MQKFLAVYIGSVSSSDKAQNPISTDTEQLGMEAWGKWVTEHAGSIHDYGSPLGKTKRASASGISDTENRIVAYTVVEAESHEAAAEMFKNHPHFSIFPGDSVEIMECIDVPGG